MDFELYRKQYTFEEQKENRQLAVAKLRSDEYEQTKIYLRNNDTFCGLGLLCDVSGLYEWEKYKWEKYKEKNTIYHYGYEIFRMPSPVMNFYGFVNGRGKFYPVNAYQYATIASWDIAYLNDHQNHNFEELADIIEGEPYGMFRTEDGEF